jgi:hypothetical protein
MAMSKIPETIETMRPEAARVVERRYSPLVKQLGLAPEQSEKFYQILLDNKMHGLAQRTELLCHGDIGRMTRVVRDFQKETDARLRALLGDANFSQYQVYQAGVGDHSTLELMKNDFAANPLSEEQQEFLLKAMESGRKTLGVAAGSSDAEFSVADPSDVMNQKLKRQESIDHQILQQAAGFLSPAQLQILSSTQAKWRTLRKEGYAKVQEMFGNHGKSEERPDLKQVKSP